MAIKTAIKVSTYYINVLFAVALAAAKATRSTANEPGRLGDQSRRMGRIRSRITINVIERLWSNWSFKTIYDQSKMRRKSPIHAIIKPPDKQSSNYNSSCTMKEAITNISQQLKYSNWYEDIQSWRFENLTPRRCCWLDWFQIFNSSRNVSASNFNSSLPIQLK